MTHVAIIGAGMAGLAAARVLTSRGVRCTIYEKSRSVGGRAATREINGFVFDYGTQYLKTPLTRALQRYIQETRAQDIGMPVWTFDSQNTIRPGDPVQNAAPKWTWPGGIAIFNGALAHGLDIRYRVEVQRLEYLTTHSAYRLFDTSGNELLTADAVLLTPPAPQTAALIAASNLPAERQTLLLDELGQSSYRCCLSLALAYRIGPTTPWYAMVNIDRFHPVSWLACEHDKPARVPDEEGLMVAQMAHDYSVEHWNEAEKGLYGLLDGQQTRPLAPYMLDVHRMVETLTSSRLSDPLWVYLHRWRYSLPSNGIDADKLNGLRSGLYFAGDYAVGLGRAHLALESGWQVAKRMLIHTG